MPPASFHLRSFYNIACTTEPLVNVEFMNDERMTYRSKKSSLPSTVNRYQVDDDDTHQTYNDLNKTVNHVKKNELRTYSEDKYEPPKKDDDDDDISFSDCSRIQKYYTKELSETICPDHAYSRPERRISECTTHSSMRATRDFMPKRASETTTTSSATLQTSNKVEDSLLMKSMNTIFSEDSRNSLTDEAYDRLIDWHPFEEKRNSLGEFLSESDDDQSWDISNDALLKSDDEDALTKSNYSFATKQASSIGRALIADIQMQYFEERAHEQRISNFIQHKEENARSILNTVGREKNTSFSKSSNVNQDQVQNAIDNLQRTCFYDRETEHDTPCDKLSGGILKLLLNNELNMDDSLKSSQQIKVRKTDPPGSRIAGEHTKSLLCASYATVNIAMSSDNDDIKRALLRSRAQNICFDRNINTGLSTEYCTDPSKPIEKAKKESQRLSKSPQDRFLDTSLRDALKQVRLLMLDLEQTENINSGASSIQLKEGNSHDLPDECSRRSNNIDGIASFQQDLHSQPNRQYTTQFWSNQESEPSRRLNREMEDVESYFSLASSNRSVDINQNSNIFLVSQPQIEKWIKSVYISLKLPTEENVSNPNCDKIKILFDPLVRKHQIETYLQSLLEETAIHGPVLPINKRGFVGHHNSNGLREGYGIYKSKNGSEYRGEWKNGKKEGFGIATLSTGCYCGHWKNNKRHGHGIMQIENGDLFEGQWSDHQKDGVGVYHYCDGEVDISCYSENLRVGLCVRWCADRQRTSTLNGSRALEKATPISLLEAKNALKGHGIGLI